MEYEMLAKLESAFLNGMSDREACLFAGIAPSTLYRYQEENPGFSERKEMLKDNVKMYARLNISKAIQEKGDNAISQWYLERKGKNEFAQKTETELSGVVVKVVKFDGDNNPLPIQSAPLSAALPAEQQALQGSSIPPTVG